MPIQSEESRIWQKGIVGYGAVIMKVSDHPLVIYGAEIVQ
jgi:hypothetical protein